MTTSLAELRWVRAFSPDLIPTYLVEQIKHRDFSIEEFYQYQSLNCLNGRTLNPFNHLYVLADKNNIVKGFLWFIIDALSKDIIINTFSIDKEYWGKGLAVKKLEEHVKELREKLKLDKVFWLTRYPKHSERYGFKHSKNVLMEYDAKKEKKNEDVKDGSDTNRRSIT